jgi:hypothetical protein
MQQSSRDSKGNILNENPDFLPSTNLKLLSQVKDISINYRNVRKFIIFVRDSLCGHLPWVLENVAAPLPNMSCVCV